MVNRKGKVVASTLELAFPELRFNATIRWFLKNRSANVTFRFIDEAEERCTTNGSLGAFPDELCSEFVPGLYDPVTEIGPNNTLDARLYADLRLNWRPRLINDRLTLSLGVNNLFDKAPPLCTSCGLKNFNATLHDVPGVFGYFQVAYRH